MLMINAPIIMAMVVPKVPAVGKKVVPGIMNAPQPIIQPKANAHTFKGESERESDILNPTMRPHPPDPVSDTKKGAFPLPVPIGCPWRGPN